ncbi:LysM peptidoglycan-binding domain-containing protein [Desulfotomaculum sp. 1211_IL3151]|uniref:LysM peptidoglycan-binding domain-containing protein n=1 Tax=Desulfotomaculum sp. 1211_IL3151 TaxID=3084055 RepID=UPI002FD98EC3
MSELQYAMELSFNNGADFFVVPVLPERVDISRGGKGKTYDIIGPKGRTTLTGAELDMGGEINVIKSPKLLEVSFSSMFPARKYPFVVAQLKPPAKYVEYITKWMKSKHPIRFIFVGYNTLSSTEKKADITFDLNIAASIEQFDWREVAGSPGDIEYTIKLKEYRFYSAKKIITATDANGNTVFHEQKTRPDTRIRPLTYTLQPGDNLWKVGMKVFGRDGRWREIQKLNNLTDADLKKLPIGMVLKIPQD